jgi:hypothetical protein
MRLGIFLVALVAAIPVSAFELSSKSDFQCKITIEGDVWLDGVCGYYPDMAEGFDVTDGKGSIVGLRVENGTARAFWNGPDQASIPDRPLGKVEKTGQCWMNGKASICIMNLPR